MNGNTANTRRPSLSTFLVIALWPMSYFASRLALDTLALDHWLRIPVALVPVPAFILFLRAVLAHIRSLDELERRIHLDALLIAFPVTVLLLMILGLLELAVELSPANWSYRHVWIYATASYFIGLAIAQRRYHR